MTHASTSGSTLLALFGGVIALGLFTLALFSGRWPDRTTWIELPCLESHTETYLRPDDRPHAQGGRGGYITAQRTVCDVRATIGPVMPWQKLP